MVDEGNPVKVPYGGKIATQRQIRLAWRRVAAGMVVGDEQ